MDVHDGSAAALFWRALATASVSTAGAGTSPPPSAADRTAARGCWSRFIAFTMSLIRRGTCASVPPPRPPRPVSTVRFQRLGLGVCAALSLHCRRCLVCDGEHVLFAGGRVRRRRCCQGSASSALEPTDVFREVYRARTRAPLSTASLLPLPKVAIRQFSEANVRTSSSFTRPSARSKACQGKP